MAAKTCTIKGFHWHNAEPLRLVCYNDSKTGAAYRPPEIHRKDVTVFEDGSVTRKP